MALRLLYKEVQEPMPLLSIDHRALQFNQTGTEIILF